MTEQKQITEKKEITEEELLGHGEKEEAKWELSLIMKKVSDFIKNFLAKSKNNTINPKKIMIITIVVSILLLFWMIWMFVNLYLENDERKDQKESLMDLTNYWIWNQNLDVLEKENVTKMEELIKKIESIQKQNKKYTVQVEKLQAPYNYFLKFLYLPSLNIWKNPFTNEIDISVVGQKYINNNPYEDTKLISKWKTFFKKVGKNIEYNEVGDIEISSITVDKENPDLFTIKIKVPFVSNTKRSFLLLINKLSMTSNPKNISLINEFSYYLRKEIKERKKDVLNEIKKDDQFAWWSDDKIIWYNLYQWINKQKSTNLIDEEIISSLVRKVMICPNDMDDTRCYYRFREKYSSLPSLAYTIWIVNKKNKIKAIKDFYSSIPMLMKVESFSFDRVKDNKISFMSDVLKYKGTIEIKLYWKNILETEINEVAVELWKSCFLVDEWVSKKLTPELAMKKIENTIANLGEIEDINNNGLDTTRIQKIWELKELVKIIIEEYSWYSNSKKIVKLFEIYRMLKDSDICKI